MIDRGIFHGKSFSAMFFLDSGIERKFLSMSSEVHYSGQVHCILKVNLCVTCAYVQMRRSIFTPFSHGDINSSVLGSSSSTVALPADRTRDSYGKPLVVVVHVQCLPVSWWKPDVSNVWACAESKRSSAACCPKRACLIRGEWTAGLWLRRS